MGATEDGYFSPNRTTPGPIPRPGQVYNPVWANKVTNNINEQHRSDDTSIQSEITVSDPEVGHLLYNYASDGNQLRALYSDVCGSSATMKRHTYTNLKWEENQDFHLFLTRLTSALQVIGIGYFIHRLPHSESSLFPSTRGIHLAYSSCFTPSS